MKYQISVEKWWYILSIVLIILLINKPFPSVYLLFYYSKININMKSVSRNGTVEMSYNICCKEDRAHSFNSTYNREQNNNCWIA